MHLYMFTFVNQSVTLTDWHKSDTSLLRCWMVFDEEIVILKLDISTTNVVVYAFYTHTPCAHIVLLQISTYQWKLSNTFSCHMLGY